MRRFDPKSYLTEVLAPHLGSAEPPSLFDRYLLDVDDGDEAAIAARLEEVKRCWDKQSEHPRYGQMVRQLAEAHIAAKLTLCDPAERARAAEQERSRRRESEQREQREVAEWEALLDQIVESAGGLDPARRAQLEKMAMRIGIPAEEATRRLDAAPVAAEPEVLAASQRVTIARALSALARDLGEPRAGLSLYHALNLGLGDETAAVAARREEEIAENRRRGHGNASANWDAVLSLVKIHLLDEDSRAYVNGLVLDVRDALAEQAIRAVADDGVIDEVEAEHLRSQALALGLTPELAQQAIAEMARENGAIVRTGEAVDVVACPSCNHPHPRPQGDRLCRRCGTALFVDCPACGDSCDATAARCSSCGADLHRHAAAMRALGRLPALLDAGSVHQAGEDLATAIEVLGRGAPGLDDLARRVVATTEAAKRSWAEAEAARDERRQYAAKRLLSELARTAADFPGPSGELPAVALATAVARVEEAEAELGRARAQSGPDRERSLVAVLRIAADCAAAERELDELPPAPPGAVTAAPVAEKMTVRWEPSPTAGVTYEVARLAAGARSRVGEADSAAIDDPRAPVGALVRYAVQAVRGRARSRPVESELVAVAYEVAGLAVDAGDGEVRLAWAPRQAGRIIVSRRDEDGAAEATLVATAGGLIDREVANGRRYTYAVAVEYPREGGGVTRTAGLTAFAQPAERPLPVAALAPQATGEGVRLEFEAPAIGVVSVFRCAEDPELEPGAEIEPRRLAELGQPLAALAGGALDREPPSGRCFYLAVSLSGNVAVAGATAAHVALPAIENVQAVANGRRALVTWSWPEGTTLARVVWRHDRQPAGPRDPDAAVADFRHGDYRDRGGFSIDLGEERSLFVGVYPARRIGNEVVYGGGGRGSRTALRNEEKTALRYSVKRAGRLQRRLEVSISEPAEGALPELVLVGREGDILPRSPAEGTVLARLGGEGPRSSSLELRGLSRPLAVRLFLDSAGAASAFVLHDPLADELLIA